MHPRILIPAETCFILSPRIAHPHSCRAKISTSSRTDYRAEQSMSHQPRTMTPSELSSSCSRRTSEAYQVSLGTSHSDCASFQFRKQLQSCRDDVPFSLRLSFKKPTSRFSLLRTRLMMTASFSLPCMPSTVPISRSRPYIGRSIDVSKATWAWYLSADLSDSRTLSVVTGTYGVMIAICEGSSPTPACQI